MKTCIMVLGPVTLAAGLMFLTSTATATCNDEDCSKGCKTHNRWCDVGEGECYLYAKEVAVVACVEVPDGGDDVEYDNVAYDKYPVCTEDCNSDDPTTGACSGESLGSGVSTIKTGCSGE